MISIRSIERFFYNHPELWEKKYPILGRADRIKDRNGVISGKVLKFIFENEDALLKLFLEDEVKGKSIRQMDIEDLHRKF